MWAQVAGKTGKLGNEEFCNFFKLFAPEQKDPEIYAGKYFKLFKI
jgi:hypothetical protein